MLALVRAYISGWSQKPGRNRKTKSEPVRPPMAFVQSVFRHSKSTRKRVFEQRHPLSMMPMRLRDLLLWTLSGPFFWLVRHGILVHRLVWCPVCYAQTLHAYGNYSGSGVLAINAVLWTLKLPVQITWSMPESLVSYPRMQSYTTSYVMLLLDPCPHMQTQLSTSRHPFRKFLLHLYAYQQTITKYSRIYSCILLH